MAIYLKDATYLDWKTHALRRTHILVGAGEDGWVGLLDELPFDLSSPEDIVLDCRGKIVTRSFACGHHHVYSALARGMPPPAKVPGNFHEVLQYVWWRLDKLLDREMIEASALATAVACAKNGVTFVVDHHASPNAVEGSLETIAEAFDRVGVSHLLCYELTDRDGDGPKEKGLAETEAYLRGGRQGHVGLHASFTVGDDLLRRAVSLAEKYGTGIHVHVAEDPIDQEECLKHHGTRVVQRFSEAGVLGRKGTLLSHCIHLDEDERRIVAESPAYVAQNTDSNLNNNVGDFTSRGLGSRIVLGTDGMHSDLLRSAKSAFLVGQRAEGIDFPGIYRRFRRVHEFVRKSGFAGDGENNLVVLDYDSPTDVTQENFLGHFVYGLESRHVESVISGGELIVRDRRPTKVNEEEVLSFAREMGRKLWAKMR
ncbi:MAG: amidohydrolase family protein [Deltaproteobacteria bacterium]|nr:amidohydrolase family protein [Deltaproteobacteria bacterium]